MSESGEHDEQQPSVCLRQCPTRMGDLRPLIAHHVAVDTCMARQREFYHKCHRCLYRGKPAGFVIDTEVPMSRATGA